MILHLISSPRTISTSLMYSFDNRPDTIGLDEPFYAYYLRHTDKAHPGKEEVFKEMPSDPKIVLQNIHELSTTVDHLFIKNMGHHLIDLPLENFISFTQIILIRNPKSIIASLSKVLDDLTLLDIAVAEQWKYYQQLTSMGCKVVVIDSTEILKNPEPVLRDLCDKIEIEFHDSMLQWPAGPRPIDGSWAPYYYSNTHASTGFGSFLEKEIILSKHNQKLYEEAISYYDQLFSKSIHV